MAVTPGGYDPRKIGSGGMYGTTSRRGYRSPTAGPLPWVKTARNLSQVGAGRRAATRQLRFDDVNSGDELFKIIPPADMGAGAGGGGGGGGRGGGGGGGGGGVDPAAAAAYRSMLEGMQNDTSVDDAWNSYIESMRSTYDPAKAAARWDAAGGAIGAAGTQGRERMGGIYNDMKARAATGREAVAGAASQGDQALQNIRARFQGASAQGAGNINNVLSNFDAGAMGPGVYQNELDSLFAAGMVGNQRMGNAYDVAFADRPQVYAALNSDITSGMTAQEQAMLNQIAAKKAADIQANEARLAEVLGTAGISRAQAQAQQQQEILKMKAELADMGITV